MTRKQERRSRIGRWLAITACGFATGAMAVALFPTPIGPVIGTMSFAFALLVAHRGMIADPGVAILTYHSVSPDPGWLPWSREISVHPRTFERHLATLARMRVHVVGTRDLTVRRRAGAPHPVGGVALHFDDGYLDNHVFALPALRRHGFPATYFVSLDFIEPLDAARHAGRVEGYMNWREIAALEAQPGQEVEPHGVAHARVPVSDRTIATLDAANWRHHAWLQWDATPGPKHDWFRREHPTAVPLGSPVPASGLALAERAWRNGVRESEETLEQRIGHDLTVCRNVFVERLGRAPAIFCWPENKVGPLGRAVARRLGYRATTGGRGRNTADEPADVLSRIHVGDRALGFRWLPAEALALRASVRLMQGNHYWYLVLAPMNVTRRAVFALRRSMGDDFA